MAIRNDDVIVIGTGESVEKAEEGAVTAALTLMGGLQFDRELKDILNHRNYEALCNQAHESVKAYTWDAYTDKIIEKIEHLLT